VNHRQEWYEQIAAYNTPDKARLAREIYAEADMYVGIRSLDEFFAVRREGLFDYAIWVDASKRLPPESAASCTVTPLQADMTLDNNGTLEQLRINTINLYWDLIALDLKAKEGGFDKWTTR
jgi:hypothetical protein